MLLPVFNQIGSKNGKTILYIEMKKNFTYPKSFCFIFLTKTLSFITFLFQFNF